MRQTIECEPCAKSYKATQGASADGIYNNARWSQNYIRVLSEAEIQTYRQAELSAKEMRKDGTV